MPLPLLVATLALSACFYVSEDAWKEANDLDKDGYLSPTAGGDDCDDQDPAVHPGASETCNGGDDDCDGQVDEPDAVDATPWYADADGDGWGDPTTPTVACGASTGQVSDSTDCDDTDGAIHPQAREICNDLDDDCDGVTDGEGSVDAGRWYVDADSDGYGNEYREQVACAAPSGSVAGGAFDCDDDDPSVHPEAEETCNGRDDDCDDTADEDPTDAPTWYADGDGDLYGNLLVPIVACDAPTGYVSSSLDCDDSNVGVHPLATETCNDLDDDCDGTTDEPDAADAPLWYRDTDGDGWGDAAVSTAACEAPEGYVAGGTTGLDLDCDDTTTQVHPAAVETCDGRDEDCDGVVDEPDTPGAPTWYADGDGDGWGDTGSATAACTAPAGHVATGGDCDDGDGAIHPGAAETCNLADDDCDGTTDEDDAEGVSTWYADTDGDTFGNLLASVVSCWPASGYVSQATDCDDSRADVRPGATETCNGRDDDCDSVTDEPDAVDAPTWYSDADGDGWGDPRADAPACEAPAGSVGNDEDCDDSNAEVAPGAVEVCNLVDDDCDGTVDGASAVDAAPWYPDTDSDGWGADAGAVTACSSPAGYVDTPGDCDDTRASVSPHGVEVCDSLDDDCDGSVDEPDAVDAPTWHADADADGVGSDSATTAACERPDGWLEEGGDCDDSRSDVLPGATEVCNGVDDNCDGLVDAEDPGMLITSWVDADGDGWGDASRGSCEGGAGTASNDDDCDDTDAESYPGGAESCEDGRDQDCDGYDALCEYVTLGLGDDDIRKLLGSLGHDYTGYAVDGAGDVNGDGYDDVIVGAYSAPYTEENGAFYLEFGPITKDLGLGYADVSAQGESDGDYLGISVAGAGDLDGDGYDDIAVGAYGEDGGGSSSGAAYVYYGPAPESSISAADAKLVGEAAGDLAGHRVIAAGDLDEDGNDDLLVGAYHNDRAGTDAGALYLQWGPVANLTLSSADVIVTGAAAGDMAGAWADGVGDVDGDGFLDIVVSASSCDVGGADAGAAYLLRGPLRSDRSLSTADLRLLGEAAGDGGGYPARAAGDMDGDGLADLLLGAYGNDADGTDAGAAYLVLGPAEGLESLADADARYTGETPGDQAGLRVAGLGDVDADGFGDLAIGAWNNDVAGVDSGSTYIILGPAERSRNLSLADVRLTGERAGDQAGYDLSGAGDVDADGHADLLVGAAGDDTKGTNSGAAYLVPGFLLVP